MEAGARGGSDDEVPVVQGDVWEPILLGVDRAAPGVYACAGPLPGLVRRYSRERQDAGATLHAEERQIQADILSWDGWVIINIGV